MADFSMFFAISGRIEAEGVTAMDWLRSVNPSLILFGLCAFLFLLAVGGGFALYQEAWYFQIPFGVINGFMVFLGFTVLHDACHFSFSRRRWMNELIMILAWPMFVFSPFLFRRIHLEHHAKTNQGDSDPDHFTASPKLWKRLMKSFFLIFYYHVFAFQHFKHPRWRRHLILSAFGPIFLIYLALITAFAKPLILTWLIPNVIGIGILSYVNTAWPHHPARETSRYRNTRNTFVPWWIQALMFNQNMHLVHHLRPSLPWYRYPEFYKAHQLEIARNSGQGLFYTQRKEYYELQPLWLRHYKEIVAKLLIGEWR